MADSTTEMVIKVEPKENSTEDKHNKSKASNEMSPPDIPSNSVSEMNSVGNSKHPDTVSDCKRQAKGGSAHTKCGKKTNAEEGIDKASVSTEEDSGSGEQSEGKSTTVVESHTEEKDRTDGDDEELPDTGSASGRDSPKCADEPQAEAADDGNSVEDEISDAETPESPDLNRDEELPVDKADRPKEKADRRENLEAPSSPSESEVDDGNPNDGKTGDLKSEEGEPDKNEEVSVKKDEEGLEAEQEDDEKVDVENAEEEGESQQGCNPVIVSVCAILEEGEGDVDVKDDSEQIQDDSKEEKVESEGSANEENEVVVVVEEENDEESQSSDVKASEEANKVELGEEEDGKVERADSEEENDRKDERVTEEPEMSTLAILDVRSVAEDADTKVGDSAKIKEEVEDGNGNSDAEDSADKNSDAAKSDKTKNKQPPDEAEMKIYATDTMNELLGLFGYEKVDDSTKDAIHLSNNLSSRSSAEQSEEKVNDTEDNDKEAKKSVDDSKDDEKKATKSGKEAITPAAKGGSTKTQQGRLCSVCKKTKSCKYQVLMMGSTKFICDDECFREFRTKQNITTAPSIKDIISENRPITRSLTHPKDHCNVCHKEIKNGMGLLPGIGENKPLCSETCMKDYQVTQGLKRACSQCGNRILSRSNCLTWEAMEFCNEECLGKYQSYLGSHCAYCNNAVQQTSLGKYCVRFGSDIKQFCSNGCLEEFKKGLKICSYCQKDISSGVEGFLAPVGDKGQFKEFCSQSCMEKYETMGSVTPSQPSIEQCSVCNKITSVKVEVTFEGKVNKLCSEPCIAAFRYANKINTSICDTCHKFFDLDVSRQMSIQFEGSSKRFCSKACMNVFVLHHRKVVPCSWCKVKKYNFDMIERVDSNNHVQLFCSLNCLSLFRVSLNATSSRRIQCDFCHQVKPAQYHLTMSDASIRNFCSYNCVMQFQSQFTGVVPVVTPPVPPATRTVATTTATATTQATGTPVISSVMSLAPSQAQQSTTHSTSSPKSIVVRQPQQQQSAPNVNVSKCVVSKISSTQTIIPTITQQVIVKQPPPKIFKNKTLMCKPTVQTKGVSCKPHPCHKTTQTDESHSKPVFIPVPVPIYVPVPMRMYTTPVPFPVAFPLPIPVPVFIPTTKNSASSIFKQIKEIQQKIPDNPFEADLILMAEMVAEDHGAAKDKHHRAPPSSSKTAARNANMTNSAGREPNFAEAAVADDACQTPNTFGDEVLQMALHMASSMEPPVELEASALSNQTQEVVDENGSYMSTREIRGQSKNHKRSYSRNRGRGRKRTRIDPALDGNANPETSPPPVAPQSVQPPISQFDFNPNMTPQIESNCVLKFSYGVNAWKHWVLQKNTQLEKASQTNRKLKLFKTDLLQLTADELNYSLCLFVKEVRKPNGDEYAPDSIYYLCLGIQQYLFENGRIDNIFSDAYYEKFTECLNEVLQRYEVTLASDGSFLSRIEEEILWECKQLGAHSPHVLLNTLMYFNTKYFMLKSVDDHMQLSFSHILKHWKKSGSSGKGPGGKNVLLRYYPPSQVKDSPRRRKETVPSFEQLENLDNPLRCPVKLYEFYLSKCPESIKSRSDVFYLYPERSCVPDSPVWYSTMSLGKETISKMLTRIRMVREVGETMLPVT